ncbi:hypothetical protein YQE_10119, partial [Dendroctonus ponderosae]
MGFGDTLNQLPEGLKQGDGAPQKNDFDLIASPETSSKKRRVELKKHECPEIGCSAKFSRPYRLKNHILTHHGDAGKPYKCTFEDCSKTYSSQSHLKRHEIAAHLGEDVELTEVLCEEENCGLIFSNKYNLKKHIGRIHADLPFECHTCSEKFRRKSQLNVHKVEIHTEEAPYNCKDCPKTFVQFHQYQKHQRSHKNYKCDCDEIFSRWTEYLKHKKTILANIAGTGKTLWDWCLYLFLKKMHNRSLCCRLSSYIWYLTSQNELVCYVYNNFAIEEN